MAKKTPDVSKLAVRDRMVAPYTRVDASDKKFDVAKTDKTEAKGDKQKAEAPKPGDGPKSATANEAPAALDAIAAKHAAKEAKVEVVEPHDGAPKPGEGPKSATHNELPTEPEPEKRDTGAMAAVVLHAPPDVPQSAKTVEDPTHMPGPRAIPEGNPTDSALPPGRVPPGDSRSLRRGNEFALVYRQANCVISRFGTVGQRGQWRVVEYPTSASASHSYAKECSRFVAEGFSDYRD